MRLLGKVLVIIAYAEGIIVMFYYGILPAIGGIWTWSDYGIFLVIGLVIAMVLYVVGQLILGNIKRDESIYAIKKDKQSSNESDSASGGT